MAARDPNSVAIQLLLDVFGDDESEIQWAAVILTHLDLDEFARRGNDLLTMQDRDESLRSVSYESWIPTYHSDESIRAIVGDDLIDAALIDGWAVIPPEIAAPVENDHGIALDYSYLDMWSSLLMNWTTSQKHFSTILETASIDLRAIREIARKD